ncbi:MAG: SpoIID/LytB domain-containing protein [Oryzihumus sp.]
MFTPRSSLPSWLRSARVARVLVPAVAGAAVLATTGPVVSARAESLPIGPTVVINGHGWGHGHGMSQYGAYGAATRGLTHTQILDFYYPGTTLQAQAPIPSLRIRISGDSDNTTQVDPAAGLSFTDGLDRSSTLPTRTTAGVAIIGWRTIRSGPLLQLQSAYAGAWHNEYGAARPGPMAFQATAGQVRLVMPDSTRRAFPDAVTAIVDGTVERTVVVTSMESYLRGVVPNEMPSSWSAEALRSQAVAARTYATYEKEHPSYPGKPWDVCDSTACQVYDGLADYRGDGTLLRVNTKGTSDDAVSKTANQVLLYGGKAAFTQFSSTNGGWMAAGDQPYLVAKSDPYDGVIAGSRHSWTSTRTTVASTLQSAYPQIGTLRSIVVTARDGNGEWGGRVRTVDLVGSSSTVKAVTGETIRSLLGLNSEWFTVVNADFLRRDRSGDRVPDLLIATTTGTLYLYRGKSSGFTAPVKVGSNWQTMDRLGFAGDLNGDGRSDLLARDGATKKLWCYPTTSTGAPGARTEVPGSWATTSIFAGAGDLTGDGNADFLGVNASTGVLMLYPGSGTCGGHGAGVSMGPGWNAMDVVVGAGDMNRDGRADLLVRQKATGVLWTYLTDGKGGWLGRVRIGAGWNVMNAIAGIGDLNGDQIPDVLARDTSNRLWLYPGNGQGMLGTRVDLHMALLPSRLV